MVKRVLSWLRGLGLGVGVLLAVAACGSTAATHSRSTATTSLYTVKSVSKSVSGKQEAVLTNAEGKTLYYYTPDKGKSVTCTGGCAHLWPPLTLPKAKSKAVGGSGVTGTFSTVSGVVTYNGWPLYTFSGDKSPSDTAGEGVGGVWFVATPGLQPVSATSSSDGGSGW